MNISIIGGNASLSKYLCPALTKEHNVTTMGKNNCDLYCNLEDDFNNYKLPLNTDLAILVAASFKGNTDEEIINTENTNAMGTLKFCMACNKSNIKNIMLISSIYVNLPETSPYFSIYSLSKKHSEELAEFYCKKNSINLTILRPSLIYDTKDLFRKHQPLFYLITDNAENGKDIILYGKNDAYRNYIHVNDLIEIIIKTIESKITGIYSCTHPDNIKLSEIAKSAINSFCSNKKILFLTEKEDIKDNIFKKDMSLYEIINFKPVINIEMGMKMIADYRKRQKN